MSLLTTFFWEYKVARKNEHLKKDLPKNRQSKTFKSKDAAIKYAKEKKDSWLQASLYEFKVGRGYCQIGSINTKGTYSEKYF